jgi:hypothetical protein
VGGVGVAIMPLMQNLRWLCASGHGRGVAGDAVAAWYAKTDFASLISN